MYSLLRPLAFVFDPEDAHHHALSAAALAARLPGGLGVMRALYSPRKARPVTVWGLPFPNAVGLAAGYDKDAKALFGLAALGFGHIEIGTVTPRPQPGNPKPRVFRLSEDEALINRLGFPSLGADVVAARLSGPRPEGVIVGVNLGKNKDTALEDAVQDYSLLARRFAPLADYLVVNVSSPNTPDLRRLQAGPALTALLSAVRAARDETPGRRAQPTPLLVKLAPDLSVEDLRESLTAAIDAGIDGVIATNTTLNRDGLKSPLSAEVGGLSGAPLTQRSLGALQEIVRFTEGRLPVISVGGVMTAEHAQARLDAGASLVQLYTGLVYGGPDLPRRIVEALA
ncbi:quinone-dependent dihydroorotate dehydrogenase [Myxococcota bacterium]|nr:quinone-dependent dihydroorotate dehydrogenase [Myxococcota bacterium]